MSKGSSICVLVSGGLDSEALLAEMLPRFHRIYPVYIRQGLAWEDVELFWLKLFLKRLAATVSGAAGKLEPLRVLSLPMNDLYGLHWSTGKGPVPGGRTADRAVYLPGRNLVLTVKAAIFCAMQKVPRLAIGSLNHNPFPDASPRFYVDWSKGLGQGLGFRIKILSPYRQVSKADLIRRNAALPFELSFSCIAPRGRQHCGRCNKCAERKRAFRKAGVKDLTRYAKN